MNLKMMFRIFSFIFIFVLFSVVSFADTDRINSLSYIVVDKPIDNSYRLNLFFKQKFNGNAFLQQRKNGAFYVFIPDTVMSAKNIKVIYRGKAKKEDVKLGIEQRTFIKDKSKSNYIRLSVDTPVNSSIELAAQIIAPKKNAEPFANIYYIIISALIAVIIILSISIYRAIKSIGNDNNSYTKFPSEFLNSPEDYIKKSFDYIDKNAQKPESNSSKVISPISTNDFNCFELPQKEETSAPTPIFKAISQKSKEQKLEQTNSSSEAMHKGKSKIVKKAVSNKTKATNPIKQQSVSIDFEETELDLPSAENLIIREIKEKSSDDKNNDRPELVTELKISANKGFYLTTVGKNSFALFGYIDDKIFFIQRFMDLTQINLQSRFYEHKDGSDLYIVRLDSYKAMLSVSDTEIKELAAI